MIQIYLFIKNNNNKKVGKSQHMEAIKGGKTTNYKKKIQSVKSNMSKSRSLFILNLALSMAVAPFTNQKVIRGPRKF